MAIRIKEVDPGGHAVVEDFGDLHAMMQSEQTRRFLGSWNPSEAEIHARLLRNAGSWALYGYGTFMVRRMGEKRIIGNCGIFHSWRALGEDFGVTTFQAEDEIAAVGAAIG
ncbi:MAG: hypothetical protein P8Y58_16100, partial [Novosphingobium sp.]